MQAEKPLPQLLPEIWDHIVSFLRRHPASPPTRPAKGPYVEEKVVVPTLIRQQELANMMAVSSEFYSRASPYLYSEIITDDLPLLLRGLDAKPNTRRFASKRDLLRRTTTLRLEYIDKTASPTYALLLQTGVWDLVSMPFDDVKLPYTASSYRILCDKDIERLTSGLDTASRAGGGGAIFPSSDILTMSAILGDQMDVWNTRHPLKNVERITLLITDFVHLLPVTKICARNSIGPLYIQSWFWPADTKVVDLVIHFSMYPMQWPEIFGQPYRVILEKPRGVDVFWPKVRNLCHKLLNDFITRLCRRFHFVDMTLYASSHLQQFEEMGPEWEEVEALAGGGPLTQAMSRQNEKEMVEAEEKEMLDHYRPYFREHKVRWKSITEADPCGACGWTAPKGFSRRSFA